MIQPDKFPGLGVCPRCDERGKRIPNADWPNQEPHHLKPEGDDIVLECPNGHKFLICAESAS